MGASCRLGGIGRRVGLKIRWGQLRGGSSPSGGTSSPLILKVIAIISLRIPVGRNSISKRYKSMPCAAQSSPLEWHSPCKLFPPGGCMHKKSSLVLVALSLSMALPSLALADGELDTTFDGDGKVTTPMDCPLDQSGLPGFPPSTALTPDNKIVVAASCQPGPGPAYNRNIALARYNANGSLDTSFGDDGKILLDSGDIPLFDGYSANPIVRAIVVQEDHKIVIAGSSDSQAYFLARLNPAGDMDTSFGINGWVISARIDRGEITSLALQADGKIVAGGALIRGVYDLDAMIWRFNADGRLDSSFVSSPTPGRLVDMAVGSDGKIIGINNIWPEDPTQERFTIARYLPSGAFDSSFHGDGVDDEPIRYGRGIGVAVLEDGRIVVAAVSSMSPPVGTTVELEQRLYRFAVDGSPDTSFGGSGRVTFRPGGYGYAVELNDIALSGGRIITAGGVNNNISFHVARYNSDGSIDTEFNEITDFTDMPLEVAVDILIQSDGKVLVGGLAETGSGERRSALARYQAGPILLPLPGFTPATPACPRLSCSTRGANCGRISDGCGGTLNCGTCTFPQICGANRPNVCGLRLITPWWNRWSGSFQKVPTPLPLKSK